MVACHPTDLAGLMGARLVTAIETEKGRTWAESKLKSITGGDEIAARFMRQDFFEYQPQFKFLIAGNHKPSLRSIEEAIRRRLHLIPFNVTVPPGDRDPELAEKLKEEWPRILTWMIAGCLEWHWAGPAPPEAVRDSYPIISNTEAIHIITGEGFRKLKRVGQGSVNGMRFWKCLSSSFSLLFGGVRVVRRS